uniref:Uncharacterized protein n=1 Tax=Crocodylus porosus TaxID=8502 RepID=A0A7M4FN52_CROPO
MQSTAVGSQRGARRDCRQLVGDRGGQGWLPAAAEKPPYIFSSVLQRNDEEAVVDRGGTRSILKTHFEKEDLEVKKNNVQNSTARYSESVKSSSEDKHENIDIRYV